MCLLYDQPFLSYKFVESPNRPEWPRIDLQPLTVKITIVALH